MTIKRLNVALQGGGAHGAFTWGVLNRLVDDPCLEIAAISGTSAGAMNAVVLGYGLHKGAREGAKAALESFWYRVSVAARAADPLHQSLLRLLFDPAGIGQAFEAVTTAAITSALSPYQWNAANVNPLRDILEAEIDFAELRACRRTKLFLGATNVRTGLPRAFRTHELTVDCVLASSCLPTLFQAVEIGGEYFWDGGYLGNPPLWPFFYESGTDDVLVVHINPIERSQVPVLASDIQNRLNEITFNSSLLSEFRAIAFVQRLLDEGWLKDEFRDRLKYIRVHSIRADKVLADLSVATKFIADWEFLKLLRDRGYLAADAWLEQHFAAIGRTGTVDLKREFLES